MNVQDLAIQQEVDRVTKGPNRQVCFEIKATIHLPSEDIPAYLVDKLEKSADFMQNYGEETIIQLLLDGSQLDHKIIPQLENLHITLTKRPLVTVGEYLDNQEKEFFSRRYVAKMIDKNSALLEANMPGVQNSLIAERVGFRRVSFQLIETALYRVRLQPVGGIYRRISGADLIRGLLTHYSRSKDDGEGTTCVGVELHNSASTKRFEHIQVSDFCLLTDAIKEIDNYVGGIFSAGLGVFFKGQHWFVFPTFGIKRFFTDDYTATIVNVPANRYKGLEKTFLALPGQLIILSTGEVKNNDVSDELQLELGNGIRYTNPDNVMDSFAEVSGNKMQIRRADHAKEFVSDPRADGVAKVTKSPQVFTIADNIEMGKLAARSGSFLQATWEYSDESLVRPGMAVRFLYMDGARPTEIFGTVVSIVSMNYNMTQNPQERKFAENSVITLFIDRKIRREN